MKIINKYKCCLLFGASKSKYLNGLHLVYVLLMLPIFGLFKYLCNYVPLNRVGFFCNDQSIMLPMRPDTVPSIMLFVVIAAFVITVIPLGELLQFRRANCAKHDKLISRNIFSVKIHPTIYFIIVYIGIFGIGVLINSILTNTLKRTVGRLRPNFIATCQPNMTLCELDNNAYISSIQCLANDRIDFHLSFPSGHSSHAFYSAIFLMIYVYYRYFYCRLIQTIMAITMFGCASFCAISRIADNKHRYSDVFAGILFGTSIALIMILFAIDRFRNDYYLTEDDIDKRSPTVIRSISTHSDNNNRQILTSTIQSDYGTNTTATNLLTTTETTPNTDFNSLPTNSIITNNRH